MFTLDSHRAFIRSFFPFPDPDRTEPYQSLGVQNASSFLEGFPNAALVDRKFDDNLQQVSHFELMDAYLKMGVPVGWLAYNVETGSKKPVTSKSKSGYKEGFCLDREFLVRTYESMRSEMCHCRPSLLGYHTNSGNAPFVIDLDFRKGEKDAVMTFFSFLERNGIDPKSLPAVLTPREGIHLYFQHYSGFHKTAADVFPEIWGHGVDVRGNGGVAIAPGSFYREMRYFKQYFVLNNVPLPPLPDFVAEIFAQGETKRAVSVPIAVQLAFDGSTEIDAACRIISATEEGSRNDTLNKMSFAAGKLIRDGKLSETEALEKLSSASENCGLEASEFLPTIKSGLISGMNSEDPYTSFYNNDDGQQKRSSVLGMKPESCDGVCNDGPAQLPEAAVDEAFIRAKRQADRSYVPGRLSKFAARGGELTDERLKKIAEFVFPEKLCEFIMKIAKVKSLDLASAIQAALCVANMSVRGARVIALDKQGQEWMPAVLFVHMSGGPTAGKSRTAKLFLKPIIDRQARESKLFEEAWENYKQRLKEWEALPAGERRENPIPERPVPHNFFTVDSTIEALLENAKNCPEGVIWHKDEAAGQSNMGGDTYNQKGSAATRSHLIAGYEGDPVMIDRKAQDREERRFCVNPYALSIWINLQDAMLTQTFTKNDEYQGYLQRFVHIILPQINEGDCPAPYVAETDGQENPDYEYYSSVIGQLLDLKIGDITKGRLGLSWSKDAQEIFNQWHHSFASFCRFGELVAYVHRFEQQFIRFALGLHYLHLAAYAVEKGIDIETADEITPRVLEKIDMERAITVADIFLQKLDQFLWMWKKPDSKSIDYLVPEQEAFAKHVYANIEFYKEPRSVREILERGYITDKTPRELCHWLKKQGFPHTTKSGNDRKHLTVKFSLAGLQPWREAIDLGRLALDESPVLPIVRTIVKNWNTIQNRNLRMSVSELADLIGLDEESLPMFNTMIKNNKLMIEENNGELLFRDESLEVARQILFEEGVVPHMA